MKEECICPRCDECFYKEECFIPEFKKLSSKRKNEIRRNYERMESGIHEEDICGE